MTQKQVNVVKTVRGATTRQRPANAGGLDRFLSVGLISRTRRVTCGSVGEPSRSNRALEFNLQLAYPTGCRISHLTGAPSCLFPGKLKLGLQTIQTSHEFQ